MLITSTLTFLVAWVVEEDFFAEACAVQMQVYFGSGDGFVAQHLLYGAKIGASFQKMRGKGVP